MSESKAELNDRWRAEGREQEVSDFRARVREECKKSEKKMSRDEVNQIAWQEAAKAFPPLPPEDLPAAQEPAVRGRIQGLGDIPASWPALPSNASQQAEFEWVQGNRLSIVEETASGAIRVHLGKAHEPAPSRSALGWLETSIRNHAKYVDNLVKALADVQTEEESTKRERMKINEIKELLGEMNNQWAEELIADTPKAIHEKVRSVLSYWARRFGLTITAEAETDLAGHVCELVTDCVDVLASSAESE